MPKTADDEMPGRRGASVAWHPVQKKYYVSFAGNMQYPFAVFDNSGKRLSSDDLIAEADVRGLWYDAAEKRIEGNGYNENGWFHYPLNTDGMPDGVMVDVEGMNQPNEQAVGTYNPATKQVLFLSSDSVIMYDNKGMRTGKYLILHLNRTKDKGIETDTGILEAIRMNYNSVSLIYTGISGAEMGVLNSEGKWVELYDAKTGFLTQRLNMPADIPAEQMFNFAYANGLYWFFDMDARTWYGCK